MPLVITATGLEQEDRLQITKVAGTIGAVFSPSLTSSTTHLIANGPGSEKYKVASQRGIPIVHPSWINACLTISSKRKIAALSIDDVAEITKQHAVKALSNLRICVTGFDLEQRNRIEGLVKSLGAMFDSDLTRECTHLVALSTTSKKYEFAIKNGIKVVGAAWIDKCVLTNDRVSEEAFPVESMPAIREAPKIKQEPTYANIEAPRSISTARKSSRPSNHPDSGRLTQRQSTPVMLKPASIRKCIEVEATKTGNSDCDSPSLLTKPLNKIGNAKDTTSTSTRKSLAPNQRKSLSIHHPQLQHSSTPKQKPTKSGNRLSQKRKSMISQHFQNRRSSVNLHNTNMSIGSAFGNGALSSLFDGIAFLIQGFDASDTEILSDEIQCQDGEVVHSVDALRDVLRRAMASSVAKRGCVLCPLGVGPEGDVAGLIVASECWVERCIEDMTLHDFDAHVLFRGVKYKAPDTAFKIGITGYIELDREQIRKLVQAMGATFTESLSKHNTHLIAHTEPEGSEPSMKVVRAKEWGVEIVSVDWLFQCADLGQLVFPLPQSTIVEIDAIDNEEVDAGKENITIDEGVEEFVPMEATAGKSLLDVLMHKERQAESPCLLSNTRAKIPPKESSPYAPELPMAITPAPQPIHRKDTTPVMPKQKTPVAPIQHPQAKSDARFQMDLSSPLKVATQESPQFQPPPKSAKKMSLPYSSTNILAQNHQSGKRDMNSPSNILELQSHEISPTTADHLEIKNARTSNDSIKESDMELADNAMRDDIQQVSNPHEQQQLQEPAVRHHQQPFSRERPGKPLFDLSEALQSVESPNANRNQMPVVQVKLDRSVASPISTPLEISFEKSLQKAHENLIAKPAANSGKDAGQNPTLAPSSIITTAILKNVRLCLGNRAISFRHEAIRICKLLGAEFMNTYQDGCTHYVQMSNASTAGGGSGVGGNEKDWKRVRSDAAEGKVAIVSPAWLTACLEKGRRVGEGEYPWTVDVNKGFWGTFVEGGEVVHRNPAVDAARARSISGSDSSGSRVSNDKLSKVPSPQKTLIGHKRTVQETSIHVEQKRKSEIEDADDALVSAVNKLISTSHKLTKKSSWPKSRTGSTVQRVPSNLEDPSTSILLAPGKNSSSSTSLLPSDIMQEHDEDSFTQAPPAHYSPVLQDPYASIVTYDDPLARAEKRRLLEQLQGPTPTTSNPGGDPSSKRLKTSDAKNGRTTAQQPFFEPSTNPRSYTRVFQITGTHVKLRAAMKEKIVRLGGKVVDSDVEWNPECTHLICAKPVNTDKCYSVIAKGGWMLKEEYIEKSFQEGRFLEEEDFEWAVEVGIANEKIACCAKKWRLQLGNFRRGFCSPLSGAYQDWIVLYVTKIKSREAGFVKVLRSGLADVTVVLLDEVDSALDLQSFTHCFTDVPSPDTEPRFSTIQKCGISVASVFYICEYLMK